MTIKTKLLLTFGLAVMIIAGLGIMNTLFLSKSVTELGQIEKSEIVLLKRAWEIKWLDEVLTASAARYIQTGDVSWKARYDTHVARLDDALKQVTSLATAADLKLFQDTSSANDALVAYETELFKFVAAGQAEQARAILYGDGYVTQKAIYASAIEQFFKNQNQRFDKSVQRTIQGATTARQVTRTISVCALVIILGFGLWLSYFISARLKNLVNATARIAVGDISVNIAIRSKDEIGGLADAFRNMIAYIKDIVLVTEEISDGDLRVDLRPRSEQDVLNTSLGKMVRYIQDVVAITERVSNKDLQVAVQPKSDRDVLNNSLQRMVTNLKLMIADAEQQNWLKDGISQLSTQLAGENSLKDVCQKAINFVARHVNAGRGVLYTFNPEQQILELRSSFAFNERDHVSGKYKLGEGVIGQVALERSPILLKNLTRADSLITTGIISDAPLNTYTFPLLHEADLYGVLELAAFEPFDPSKQEFLAEANRVIATALFSAAQRERVQELLQLSQETTKEAERAKAEAQQQAEEAQRANVRLEEQQQELQQQSEELQQMNAQLEEREQQLRQQQEELRQQNEHLKSAQAELERRTRELEVVR